MGTVQGRYFSGQQTACSQQQGKGRNCDRSHVYGSNSPFGLIKATSAPKQQTGRRALDSPDQNLVYFFGLEGWLAMTSLLILE